MKRICMFLAMALLFAAASASFAGEVHATKAHEHGGCLMSCRSCASVCEKTINYCRQQGGKHAEDSHLNAISDCIQACKLSENFMKRGSQMSGQACKFCREACLKCAETCDAFAGDKVMKDCADECRKCAQSCEGMSG